MESEEKLPNKKPKEIIINLIRPKADLTPFDIQVLQKTLRVALDYAPTDQSYRLN